MSSASLGPASLSPVSILTFRNSNDEIIFKAFVPRSYSEPVDPADPDSDFDQFIQNIYQNIEYNPETPLNNSTKYGKFIEHHTRFVRVHLEALKEGDVVYFSLYEHSLTNYLCIHRESPINFDKELAMQYSSLQSDLIHVKCDVTIV